MRRRAVICPTDEVLAAWITGALDAAERDSVDDHAAECPSCRHLAIALAGVAPGPADAGSLGAEGATIGRYRVTGSIGHGAMGVVLRGHDPVLDREVAIKMVNSADVTPASHARMLQEAQTLARIDHPNVVRVYDAGELGDEVFVAMAYVSGPTLARWLAVDRALDDVLAILETAGRGLAAIHALELIHRDIKPDNIVIHDGTAVIVDLGLARVQGATGSGIAGTPEYLAPEVAAGRPATAASDQYAWWRIVDDSLRGVALPGPRRVALEAAVARGRSRDPRARFASMEAAVEALLVAIRPPASRRRRNLVLVVAATLAIAGGGLAVRVMSSTSADDDCSDARPAGWIDQRATIADHLRRAGADADRVVAAIDARAAKTGALSASACHVAKSSTDREQRSRALRQQLCVDATWSETEHIFAGLVADAPHVVKSAVDSLIQVLPVERCGSGSIPAEPAPPGPDKRAEAVAVQAALREMRLARTTKPADYLAKLRGLEARVVALDYAPDTSAWRVDMAGALKNTGDLVGARKQLEAAAATAEAAGDDDSRTRVLIDLLRLSYDAGSADSAAAEAAAESATTRLGNPAFTAELRISQGLARFTHGDITGALAAMTEASSLFESIAIDAHAQLVNIAQNLGGAQQAAGDLDAAQATYDRGVELARKRYGDDDVNTLEIRGARGTNLMYRGKLPEARGELADVAQGLARTLGDAQPTMQARGYLCELDLDMRAPTARETCDEALAIAERILPATHPQLAWPLSNVGRLRVDAGQFVDAIAPLERALALTETHAVAPTDHAAAAAYLALALHALHRDPTRAAALAKLAVPLLASVPSAAPLLRELLDVFR